ncbi:cell division protein ZapB [Flavobacterium nitrogenifigens]|nr:cell division protein ZapB [Flavobacterium nitrogenifigens]
MKNKLLPLLFVLGCYSAYSQVGIGKKEVTPSAQLEVFATDKGMLIPRVALTGLTDATTIKSGNINSLLVFNTATVLDVKPGYYYWYEDKWNRIVISGEVPDGTGNVTFNPTTNQFTYIDIAGNTQVIDIESIIKANEVVTTLVKDTANNGKYVYTSEDATVTTIDVVGDVITNASSIFNNPAVTTIIQQISELAEGNVTYNSTTNEFSYVDATGTTKVININDIVKLNETITTLTNNGAGSYTYKNEEGASSDINVVQDVIDNSSTIFSNTEVKKDITTLVESQQTVTTLVKDTANNGKYVYTSEDATETTIDVVGDVITNASSIFNNPAVTTIIQQISELAEGNVTYNSTTNEFSYVDATGTTKVININDIVKLNETVTTLTNNGAGSYTYKNEEGASSDINVVQDVIDNSSTIFANTDVVNEITKLVESKETVTTLVKDAANDGKYVYTSEDATVTTIDVVGDVINNASSIFNNPAVTTIIQQISELAEGNVTYNSTTNEFSYVDATGTTKVININDIVKLNETITTLTNNGAGSYTYKNEEGTSSDINVVQDVIDNSSTIFANTDVVNEITKLIENKETLTSLVYDATAKTLTYTDENNIPNVLQLVDLVGDAETKTTLVYDAVANTLTYNGESGIPTVISLVDLVGKAETITTLANNGAGSYTYKNEEGASSDINVVQDVIDNSSTIFANTNVVNEITKLIENKETLTSLVYDATAKTLTYTDENNIPNVLQLVDLVGDAETKTTLVYDAVANTLTYNGESGIPTVISLVDLVGKAETITTLANNGAGSYTYKNEEGASSDINVVQDVIDNSSTIFANTDVVNEITKLVESKETVTTLVKDAANDGKYVYTNEDAAETTIDVVGDVINNASSIFNNPAVTTIIQQISELAEGNVTYNSTTNEFSYVDATGTTKVININDIVKLNETITTLTNNGAGSYTYKNEEGASSDINVVQDVIDNSSTIFANTDVVNEITKLVESKETVTTLVKDAANDGKYVYTNEDAAETTIDVVGDVINNASSIFNNPAVTTIIQQISELAEGNVTYNSTTNEFSYVDATGTTKVININDIVKLNETVTTLTNNGAGSYTYKNEEGTSSDINVVQDVIDNSSAIFANTDVVNEITKLIENKETLTSLVYDATAKTLTYIDENNIANVLQLVDLVGNAETKTTLVYDAVANTLTYNGESGIPTVISLVDLVGKAETITSVTPVVTTGNTIATYTNETLGAPVAIKETVTALTDVVTQEQDQYGQLVDKHTLTYKDETGTDNPIDMSVLVKGTETLTSLTYDGATQSLVYQDENGVDSEFKLVDLVGDAQTLTKLEVNSDAGTLDYTDEDNKVNALNLADVVKEPWFSTDTNKGATSNTENVYTQGWVGIGFTTPSSAPSEKLRVNGAITTVNSYYADYVFEDYFKGFSEIKGDYKFKPLAEVDAFIKKNKHLPGITPINELVKTKEGYSFNVSELSIQLLEKTEELYLHIIEQDKELEVKNSEIQQLKAAAEQLKAESEAMNERLEKLEKLISTK